MSFKKLKLLPQISGRPFNNLQKEKGDFSQSHHTQPNELEAVKKVLEGHVNPKYYLDTYSDVRAAGVDPLDHFVECGWMEGRNPSSDFNTNFYISSNADVQVSGMNPLLHYVLYGEAEGRAPAEFFTTNLPKQLDISSSPGFISRDEISALKELLNPYFDGEFYLRTYTDVAVAQIDPLDHYLTKGWAEGRDPSEVFQTNKYLESYSDVKAGGLNPLVHYALYGKAEGRSPLGSIDATNQSAQSFDVDPCLDFQEDYSSVEKVKEVITPFFDIDYYLKTYHDVALAGLDPVEHFIYSGWMEGRNPTRDFNTKFYLNSNPDVKESGLNPFLHFILFGRSEARPTSSVILDLLALKPVQAPWSPSGKFEHQFEVSVIIPTYNRAHMLPGILDAWKEVDRVTKYSYELIFSDDGSSDNSLEVLRRESHLPLKILANDHGGAAKSRNAAIRAATGKKLLIIGDDIFPDRFLINRHVEKLRLLKVTDAVLGECDWHPDLKPNHLMRHITEVGCEQFSYAHLPKNSYTDFRHFYTCNISIDREFLLSVGTIFDEQFYKVNFEDVELGYRLAKKGMQIYYYPEAYGDHHHSYSDVSRFCGRQEIAGEMALVFVDLHNEAEQILGLREILRQWKNFDKLKYHCHVDLYKELTSYCQYLEDNFNTREPNLSTPLSVIYSKLFRFAFQKGVVQGKDKSLPVSLLNTAMIETLFDENTFKSLAILQRFCGVPTYLTIFAGLRKALNITPILTVEAEDVEHLQVLTQKYHELAGELAFRLRTDTPSESFIYKPKKGFYLSVSSIRQLLLMLSSNKYLDTVLLSFGLKDLPSVGLVGCLENGLIQRGRDITHGKVIRILDVESTVACSFGELWPKDLILDEQYGYFGFQLTGFPIEIDQTVTLGVAKAKKPVIFVLPTFIGVGGVERNTSDVMSHLKNEYDFVVVTFERLSASQGSLHRQFLEHCVGIYDLTEIGRHSDILSYLNILASLYSPQAVWICNGSPWQAENTENIRAIFEYSGIIDQEAYDTSAGWIELYKSRNAGLLSFNRFIAINTRIRDIFEKSIGIKAKKIDLIYSVISKQKRASAISQSKDKLRLKYGLVPGKKYFGFIGRLTAQKAPMDLMRLILAVVGQHGDAYNFLVIGSGELSSEVDAFIVENNLSSNVKRLDYVENTFEVGLVVEGIIFTSLYEGLSIALLEALSVGTPGLSTDVGDTRLVFEKYGNGMVFEAVGDIAHYTKTFNSFVGRWDELKVAAERNKDVLAEAFGLEHISDQYLHCFSLAIADARKGISL